MTRVFVSYSRNNLDTVTQIVKDMKDAGVEIWHDQALTGGQRWWNDILANIRECEIFVFALSPESWDSDACRSELGYVVQLGKPILPVLVSEGINLNLLSPPLNEIQVTDYRRRDKEAAFALLKSIHMAPPTPLLPDPLPSPPQVPISYLSTLKDRIDSKDPLNSQDQITLFFELEQDLQDAHSQTETRDLLLRLRRRDDLLAKIASKIDAALKSMESRDIVPHGSAVPPAKEQDSRAGEHRPPKMPLFCPQCHTQVAAGLSFCGKCGANLSMPSTVAAQTDHVSSMPGSKSRRYMCESDDVPRLIADVKGWLSGQGFDSQQLSADSQSLLLQIKKRGGWRDFVGMATSLNILFRPSGDTLTVEIGAGKWVDKAAVGAVSMLILWPLAITAGIGAWEQMKTPEKIFDYIGNRLIVN